MGGSMNFWLEKHVNDTLLEYAQEEMARQRMWIKPFVINKDSLSKEIKRIKEYLKYEKELS
jgi:hypothetical protein